MAIKNLTSTSAVDALLTDDRLLWVFKHSNACGISFAAKDAVDAHLAANPEQPLAMVVIQSHRPVSNHIATVLGRVHQSPQLFLVRGGQVLWTATHYAITAEAMATAWSAAV
ncbi:MAG: bacillithiol system redox-active protein YtxJ [Planctomycetota bacterium]|jgi:bacillithiol system protein YtxJ